MKYRFASHGRVFATRERGAKVRQEIEALLRSAPPGQSCVLDFAGVEMISFSFADEVVGRLLSDRAAGSYGDRSVLVGGAGEDVRDPISRSLARRELLGAFLEKSEELTLTGPEHLRETFAAAVRLGEFSAPQIAEALRLRLPAANNRLRPLVAAGLLTRRPHIPVHGGHGFVYRLAFS